MVLPSPPSILRSTQVRRIASGSIWTISPIRTTPFDHISGRGFPYMVASRIACPFGQSGCNQAVQQVQAGLKAIYVSGWQVAADSNGVGQMYPDQSLYPVSSVPCLARAINNALTRADQIHHVEGDNRVNWFAPIVADAEAGF